jgi:hypothetical protein
MIGLIKLLALVATCLLFIDGLQEMDWDKLQLGAGVKPFIELLLQGKEIAFAFLERFPWFARAAGRATEIEGAVAGFGFAGLAVARRVSFSEFVAKFIVTMVVLSLGFLLIASNGLNIMAAMRSAVASQSWCMGLVSQIEARERFPNQMAQLQIPPIRQEFVEGNCGRYGLSLP